MNIILFERTTQIVSIFCVANFCKSWQICDFQ